MPELDPISARLTKTAPATERASGTATTSGFLGFFFFNSVLKIDKFQNHGLQLVPMLSQINRLRHREWRLGWFTRVILIPRTNRTVFIPLGLPRCGVDHGKHRAFGD